MELSFEINEAITKTRQKLLENFDDEVREKLREQADKSQRALNKFEQLLIRTTRHELNGHAEFVDESTFQLRSPPFPEKNGEIPLGLYELPRRSGEAHLYRLNHPLAEAVLAEAKARVLPSASIQFDYSEHRGKITILEPLRGQAGWLTASLFSVEALDQAEDYFVFAAILDSGQMLDEAAVNRLLTLPGRVDEPVSVPEPSAAKLENQSLRRQEAIRRTISERNARFFEAEIE